jgi:hypothetical protein
MIIIIGIRDLSWEKVEDSFLSSFCIFFKGKIGKQNLDKFMKIYIKNINKPIKYLSFS